MNEPRIGGDDSSVLDDLLGDLTGEPRRSAVALLSAARSPAIDAELVDEDTTIGAMLDAFGAARSARSARRVGSSEVQHRVAQRWGSRLVKGSVVAGAVVLSTGAAAAAGVLPDRLQSTISRAVRHVGFDVPDPRQPSNEPAPPHGESDPVPASSEPGAPSTTLERAPTTNTDAAASAVPTSAAASTPDTSVASTAPAPTVPPVSNPGSVSTPITPGSGSTTTPAATVPAVPPLPPTPPSPSTSVSSVPVSSVTVTPPSIGNGPPATLPPPANGQGTPGGGRDEKATHGNDHGREDDPVDDRGDDNDDAEQRPGGGSDPSKGDDD